jgi:ribosomal protein S27E
MAIEVTCANCQGDMVVDEPGSVVTCPHCGEQLATPEDEGGATTVVSSTATVSSSDDTVLDVPSGILRAADSHKSSPDFGAIADAGSGEPDFSGFGDEAAAASAVEDEAASGAESPAFELADDDDDEEADGESTAVIRAENMPDGEEESPVAAAVPADEAPAPARKGVSRGMFQIVLYYAIGMTALCVYLLRVVTHPSRLENLPDVVLPPDLDEEQVLEYLRGEGVSWYLSDPPKKLPYGHTLRLGERRRYGDVYVTPLKVTREPLKFVYFDGDEEFTREPSRPVLKLWFKFENAGQDRAIAPLDRYLVQTHKHDGLIVANTFLRRQGDDAWDERVLPFVLPVDSEWRARCFDLGPLQPKGRDPSSYEMCLPSEEDGIDALEGPLVWRVHVRKGYCRPTGLGVTTLIDVRFDASDIIDRTEAESTPDAEVTARRPRPSPEPAPARPTYRSRA